MNPLKLEVTNEPEKEDLLNEEENQIENKDNTEINYEYQLIKCFPNLKECQELYPWNYNFEYKYEDNEETNNYKCLDFIGYISGFSICFFWLCIIIFYTKVIAIIIIYLILVGAQFLHPEIKSMLKARENNKNDFEEFKNKINEITKANISIGTKYEKEGSFDFVVKNYIDISGELDMTKPPKVLSNRRINSQQRILNNKVIILTYPTRIYTVEKETPKKLGIYKDELGSIDAKMPENIGYFGKFYRECNYYYLISTLFLCSSFFFKFILGKDVYFIEPRKIISCEEDLNNNFYVSLCLNFKPKYIFYTGEQVIYKDNCIIKADDEKINKFNDNYKKMVEERNKRIEEENKQKAKCEKYGIYPGLILYQNCLGNLKIKAKICSYYSIEIDLVYCLNGEIEMYSNYTNRLIITDDIYFDCLKEDLEVKGDLNYLYIKYLKYPIIIGNYYALAYNFSYRDDKHTFAYL